jgi:hypothetical protein
VTREDAGAIPWAAFSNAKRRRAVYYDRPPIAPDRLTRLA